MNKKGNKTKVLMNYNSYTIKRVIEEKNGQIASSHIGVFRAKKRMFVDKFNKIDEAKKFIDDQNNKL